ncbi:MAG TPA: dephospho-CoA kinase [Acidimicrobiia bacterium]|nr:dephospho-CoA kinase [Acidimicrobiia bacterium]
MKFVGLSGVIGSGKSTVGAHLASRGADVIDVDAVSRELQEPGGPLYASIVDRWGERVLDPDGRLDRAALGEIVFHDRAQLGELTMMAAPLTEDAIVARASESLGTDRVVVVEAAMHLARAYGMEGLLLVDLDPEVAVTRLVEHRGMREDDARARLASQLPRDVRLEHADFVIDNGGTPEDLDARVGEAWAWITTLPDATPASPRRIDTA